MTDTTTFETLGLPATMLTALKKVNFHTPTPIQAEAIPLALAGRDVLGSAQTGTGKTAAFGIPMIAKLIAAPESMAIIMTPTRELAAQVLSTLQPLLAGTNIRTALLIGGESMGKQHAQLKGRPRIIVGTPGRINDHLEQRTLNLSRTNFLVLDETDRMLDMGFGVQIDRILKHMPPQRQTLLFSATIPPEIEKMASRYQKNPARIAVGSSITPVAKIKQETLNMREGEKYDMLIQQLYDRKGSVIVFVKTKFGAKRMAEKLNKMADIKADAIHGNLNQNQRNRVISAYREKRFRVMIATDVAARGLDIPHIEHVINYDLPQCPEDYIHRIGRTARNGAEGNAIAFITPADGRLWHAIHKLMNPGDKTKTPPSTNDRPQNRGNRKKFGDKPRGKFNDRPRRKFDDRPAGEKKFGDRKFGEKKFGEKKFGDKPAGEKPRGTFGDRPRGNFNDKPRGKFGDRPNGDRPAARTWDSPRQKKRA